MCFTDSALTVYFAVNVKINRPKSCLKVCSELLGRVNYRSKVRGVHGELSFEFSCDSKQKVSRKCGITKISLGAKLLRKA